MLATELLVVYIYCLFDDAIKAGTLLVPRRPGPAPACTDAELLTIALVRHLLGRRSESGFLAEIRRDWLCLFPHLPHRSEVNRRIRWPWVLVTDAAGCVQVSMFGFWPGRGTMRTGGSVMTTADWTLRSGRTWTSSPSASMRQPSSPSSRSEATTTDGADCSAGM